MGNTRVGQSLNCPGESPEVRPWMPESMRNGIELYLVRRKGQGGKNRWNSCGVRGDLRM